MSRARELVPRLQTLSNGHYHVMVTREGTGLSRCGLAVSCWLEEPSSPVSLAMGRPSAEDIYKIYAESFRNALHLQAILQGAQAKVDTVIGPK